MKKLLVLMAGALLLASCSLQPGSGSGSISVSIPKSVQSRNIGDIARVSLTRYDRPVALSGSEGALESPTGQVITIDKLVPGSGYRISLSIGTKPSGVNLLVVQNFAESDEFAIVPGGTTDLSLTLLPGVYTYLTTSGNSSSAAKVGTTYYLNDGNTLGTINQSSDGIEFDSVFALDSTNILSLTSGFEMSTPGSLLPQLWLNTDAGIFAKSDGTNWSNIVKIDGVSVTDKVRYSKAIVVSANVYWEGVSRASSVPTLLAMYNSGGLNLGGIIAANPDSETIGILESVLGGSIPQDLDFLNRANNKWTNVNSIISGYPDIVDLANTINSDVVSDITTNTDDPDNSVIYASSSLGTLVVTANMRNELTEQENNPDFSPIGFYEDFILNVGSGNDAKSIRSLSSTGGKIFAGTDRGLYVADMEPADGGANLHYGIPTAAGFSLISGTEEEKFASVSSLWNGQAGGQILTAAISHSGTVYIVKNASIISGGRIPAAAGTPGAAKATWINQDTLLLTGSNGAVVLRGPF